MIFDPLQLAIIGLGSDGTSPQPSGNHLRWAFGSGLSFPEEGFHLYRRRSKLITDDRYLRCIDFKGLPVGERLPERFRVRDVELHMQGDASVVSDAAVIPAKGIHAKGTVQIDVLLPVPCRFVRVQLSGQGGTANLHALSNNRVLAERKIERVNHPMSDPSKDDLTGYGITTLRIVLQGSTLVGICYRPLLESITDGSIANDWSLIADLTLPQRFSDCERRIISTGKANELRAAFNQWIGPAISALTTPDPAKPQATRRLYFIDGRGNPVPEATNAGDRVASSMNILSLLLMGAMEPDFARMLGLGWVDRTAPLKVAFDYLVVGYWASEIRYAIAYDIVRGPAPTLGPPGGMRAEWFQTPVAMPGQTGAAIGVTWDVPLLSPSTPVGLDAVWYDLRGAYAGSPELTMPGSIASSSRILNNGGRIVIGETQDASGNTRVPEYNFIHHERQDGWWGYSVKGYDIFGRESNWSGNTFVKVLDTTPPPAPRLLEVQEGGTTVHVPVTARHIGDQDPLSTTDRALLTASGASNATVVEWTWFAEQQALAPDMAEFRIYFHPSFRSARVSIIGIAPATAETMTITLDAPPPFDVADGVLASGGNTFAIVSASGAMLTVSRATKPQADGSIARVDPVLGAASILENFGNPRSWQERIHVEPKKAIPVNKYTVLIPGRLLSPTQSEPVATGWIGVTAADDKSYIDDDPARRGPHGGRTGNESNIAVRARITAVDRAEPPLGPIPFGPEYASRADFHGVSRYPLTWVASPPIIYHVWRATESAVTASDYRARRDRAEGTHYHANSPFADDPDFSVWLTSNFAGMSQAELLAKHPSTEADEIWEKWRTRFYERKALSDATLRDLANRVPNARAFTRLTPEALHSSSFPDEFDGRVIGRYIYKLQAVNPNGLTGSLGPASLPVRLHDVLPPAAPVFKKIKAGDRSVNVSWGANSEGDLDHYELYRMLAGQKDAVMDIRLMERRGGNLPPGQLCFEDAGLTPAREYDYILVAVDISGNKSEPSLPKRVRTVALTPPSPPVITASRAQDGSQVLIAWTPPEEGTRGLVERSKDGSGRWQTITGWLPVGQSSFADADPLPEAARYRVKLQDAVGNISSHSNDVLVT